MSSHSAEWSYRNGSEVDTHEEAEGSDDEDLSYRKAVACQFAGSLETRAKQGMALAKRQSELEQFILEVNGILRERDEVRGRFEIILQPKNCNECGSSAYDAHMILTEIRSIREWANAIESMNSSETAYHDWVIKTIRAGIEVESGLSNTRSQRSRIHVVTWDARRQLRMAPQVGTYVGYSQIYENAERRPRPHTLDPYRTPPIT